MKKFELVLLLIFSCFAVAGVYHHELWIDEAHHWLIARDSTSLPDLIYNMRYDGHPAIWNILLLGISKFTHNPIGMQLLNAMISILAVFVFLRHSPFSRLEKTLFIFGYFIFYEYSVISRNYALFVLFLFLVIVQLSKSEKNYLLIGLLLALLSNIHLFALIVSVGIVIYIIPHLVSQKGGNTTLALKIGCFLFLVGVILCILQVKPPTDSPFLITYDGLLSISRIKLVLSSFVKAFIPIADFTSTHFWNSNLLIEYALPLAVVISAPLFFLPFLFISKKPVSLFFYYFSLAGILGFVYLTGLGSVRYFGFIYVLFISTIWLAKSEVSSDWIKLPWQNNVLAFKLIKHNSIIVWIILGIQALAGITTYTMDFAKPFSASKQAAEFISANFPEDYQLLTFHAPTPSVCSYLQNKVYRLEDEVWGSYFHWEENLMKPLDETKLLKRAIEFTISSKKKTCLILYRRFNVDDPVSKHFRLLRSVERGAVRTEEFHIYSITP